MVIMRGLLRHCGRAKTNSVQPGGLGFLGKMFPESKDRRELSDILHLEITTREAKDEGNIIV